MEKRKQEMMGGDVEMTRHEHQITEANASREVMCLNVMKIVCSAQRNGIIGWNRQVYLKI